MITKPNKKTVKQSEDFKSYSFGIKKEGLAHIFNVLRNQLYSDKVLAVIREYSTNAVDAHAEVGKLDEPIKVTLPNQLSPYFKVRDYGRGLTEKQIGQIYAMYGESTKRGTNEQIGQLGLGSKSAFAYGDNFVINSFVKGTKTSYNAFIDDTQIGQISKLTSEKSKEKDGIEIVIPTKEGDFDSFKEKALSLFTHFKVRPQVEGVDEGNFYKEDAKSLIHSDDWTIRNSGDSVAVMGNIAYPLSTSALDLPYGSPEYQLVTHVALCLYVNIGDLDISASREALQYTDETKKAIIDKLQSILKQIPQMISDEMKDCKNLWEAKMVYGKLFSHGGLGHQLRGILEKQQLFWRGVKISDNHFSFADKSKAVLKTFALPDRWSKAKRVKQDEAQSVLCSDDLLLVIDDRKGVDFDSGVGVSNRIHPLVKEYDSRPEGQTLYKRVFLLSFKNKAAEQEFYTKAGTKKFTKLNSLPKVKLSDIYGASSGGGTGIKSSKHTTKEFIYDVDKASKGSNWATLKSEFFDESSVDLASVKEGVYIKIDRFMVQGTGAGETHPCVYAKDIVKACEQLNISVPKVYAFKPNKAHGIKHLAKWTELGDWMVAQVKDKFGAELHRKLIEATFIDSLTSSRGYGHRTHHSRVSKTNISEKDNHFGELVKSIESKHWETFGLNKESSLHDLIEFYAEKSHKNDHDKLQSIQDALGNWIEKAGLQCQDIKDGLYKDWATLLIKCDEKYPMLKSLDRDLFFDWRNNDDTWIHDSINYVNVIDSTWNLTIK